MTCAWAWQQRESVIAKKEAELELLPNPVKSIAEDSEQGTINTGSIFDDVLFYYSKRES